MSSYVVGRLVSMIPTLVLVTVIVFVVINLTPGDPVAFMLGPAASEEQVIQLRELLGLDEPVWKRYFSWLANASQGDFGESLRSGAPVMSTLLQRMPATAELMAGSMFVAIFLGIPLGILSAIRRNTWIDAVSRVIALLGISMPSFWIGLVAILLLSYAFPILPPSGREGFTSLILPAFTLGLALAGTIMRLTRSSMLEVLGEDYIRTARAKGLAESMVIYRHALRNALMPVTTIVGLQMAALLGGTVTIETVFAWPGLGFFTYQAMLQRDYPVIMGSLFLFAVFYLVINFCTDLLYMAIDTRVAYNRRK